MTLSYLEKVDFQVLFSWFIRWVWNRAQSKFNYSPLGRQDHPQSATHAGELWVVQSGWWDQALFLVLRACLLDTFPQLQVISFHAREDRALISAPGGTPVVLRTLPPSPYSPVLYPANFSYLSLPRLSAPCPQLGKSPRVPCSYAAAQKYCQSSQLGQS